MEITQEQINQVQVLRLKGKLDALNSKLLEDKINQLLDKKEYQVLLDCKELQYISSSGLRVFLYAAKQSNIKRGKLALSTLNESVKMVLDITGFSVLFSIFSDESSALKAHF